ncbi:MAG: TolB family protein [Actinomycetota bacterium]
MNRKTLVALAAGSAVLAVPAAASAVMAYVTTPRNINTPRQLVVANDDGTSPRTIAPAMEAAISPDGTMVADMTSSDSSSTGFSASLVELASGTTVSLGSACVSTPVWSPNSRTIACQTQSANAKGFVTGNGLGLFSVPTSLAGVTSLPIADFIAARGNGVDYSMAFSPDSASIAYAWKTNASRGLPSLFVAPLSNAAARVRVLARGGGPVWGTLGIVASQATNVRVRMGGSLVRTVHNQLWVVQPNGTGARRITNYRARGLTAGPFATAISPSGGLLAGGVGGQDQQDLGVVNVASGAVRIFSRGTFNDPVAFSADGQRILYSTGSDGGPQSIRTIGVNGGSPRVIVRNAGGVSVSTGWNG